MTDEAPTATALHEFDAATALTPGSVDGTYEFDVHPGFTVGPKPNGGYLLAVAAKAAGLALADAGSSHRDALAASAHYLWAPDPGPASISVDVFRTGRGASQARAVISQDGRQCVDVTLTMGTLPDPADPPTWSALPPVDVAPIDECMRVPADPPGGTFKVSIMERCDLRLDPSTLEWALGAPRGIGELKGWISFADGRQADPLSLLFFLDALPPATFDIARSGWVPTLSLTAYLRAAPAPGPPRVVQRAQHIAGGRLDEVCELWDSTGTLVAHSTQLAAIRFDPDQVITPYPG